jgi:hypothetical protein
MREGRESEENERGKREIIEWERERKREEDERGKREGGVQVKIGSTLKRVLLLFWLVRGNSFLSELYAACESQGDQRSFKKF